MYGTALCVGLYINIIYNYWDAGVKYACMYVHYVYNTGNSFCV